jgi:hypothetical protein
MLTNIHDDQNVEWEGAIGAHDSCPRRAVVGGVWWARRSIGSEDQVVKTLLLLHPLRDGILIFAI